MNNVKLEMQQSHAIRAQPRFQSWGPISWSRLLYRTKYGWFYETVNV